MNSNTCILDGFGPLSIVRPASVAELADVIRRAGAVDAALYPFGGRTKISFGSPPAKPGEAVDLRSLANVIDFPARDMTITVQAGITIKTLQDILAGEKLRLPIDVARADQATLGGILATNTSGPRRYGYGTLRDYVIGISAFNDEGREFKSGGRVVKNVAGYDLCKLLVGSLGTLGIVTQVTLKLRPCPEQQAICRLACAACDVEAMLTTLHESRTRPTCIELLNRAAATDIYTRAGLCAPATPWVIFVGYDGNAEAVSWQVQQLVKEVGTRCRLEARVDFPADPVCHAAVEFAAWPEDSVVFKASMLPHAVAGFCQSVDGESERPALRAHAGSGIVYGRWNEGMTKERAATLLTTWRDLASKGQGFVVVMQCPAAWKSAFDVWGPAPPGARLMREIKKQFDPRRLFNPGRFVDGI